MRNLKTTILFEWFDQRNGWVSPKEAREELGLASSTIGMALRHLTKEGLLKQMTTSYKKKLYTKTSKWSVERAKKATLRRLKVKYLREVERRKLKAGVVEVGSHKKVQTFDASDLAKKPDNG